jgi:import inner membrane translocase subunit TIM44
MAKAGKAAGSAALIASAPLRRTEAYKAVAEEITEALDDAGSNVRYGGYVEKEDRRRRRLRRLEKAGKEGGLGARRIKTEINLEYVRDPFLA